MTKPRNPIIILVSAILLPGSGHVWLGLAQRGLMFLFFIIMLGWASQNLMPSTSSFIGKNIGGIFVYGVSIIDAYRIARIRLAEFLHAQAHSSDR